MAAATVAEHPTRVPMICASAMTAAVSSSNAQVTHFRRTSAYADARECAKTCSSFQIICERFGALTV